MSAVGRAVTSALVLAALCAACTGPSEPAPTLSSTASAISSTQPNGAFVARPHPNGQHQNGPVEFAYQPNPAPREGLITSGSVNDADPTAVAFAVVSTINRADSRTDLSWLDAVRRAARWLTPGLLAGSISIPERGDANWTAMAAHDGYSDATNLQLANEYGQPANTTTTARVQISYQLVQVGRDGWKARAGGTQLARLVLARRSTTARWLVQAFQ